MSKSILNKIKLIALDLDGVVYTGHSMIDGADKTIELLRKKGLKIHFITNNSFKTRKDIVNKLINMGILTNENEILTSAYLAGNLIKTINSNKRVFVIGMDGLNQEIDKAGAIIVDKAPFDIIVIGLDKQFSYEKISKAMHAIIDGAIFIACNRDVNYPGDNGILLPGCGSLIAAIETAVGFPPHFVVGKPNISILKMLRETNDIQPDEILVIGDNIDSDIKMAVDFGSRSILVADCNNDISRPFKPTFIIQSLKELPLLFE